MSKVVILIEPFYDSIPIGVYEVEHETENCYVIYGVYHNKYRFIDCSSLLLELF